MNIIVLDGYCLNHGDLSWERLSEIGNLKVYDRTSPKDVVERCIDAEVVLTNKTVIESNVLSQLPVLKYIGVLATGYNVIDIEEANKRGIVVTNVPAYSTDSVAQMVFAHILNITNMVSHYAQENRDGKWEKSKDFSYSDTPLIELKNKSFGIVGLGHIGMAVAEISRSFGMKVNAVTSKEKNDLPDYINKMGLNKLLSSCDIVSLHVPLTNETHNLINRERLSLMKPSAILINTSRGQLIDEKALADALNNDRLFSAGLDVLCEEPPRKHSPLLQAKNCYITPHIAWATKEARERLLNIVIENVNGFVNGKIINNIK